MSARIWQYRRNKARFWRPAKKYRKGARIHGRGPAVLSLPFAAALDETMKRLWLVMDHGIRTYDDHGIVNGAVLPAALLRE